MVRIPVLRQGPVHVYVAGLCCASSLELDGNIIGDGNLRQKKRKTVPKRIIQVQIDGAVRGTLRARRKACRDRIGRLCTLPKSIDAVGQDDGRLSHRFCSINLVCNCKPI